MAKVRRNRTTASVRGHHLAAVVEKTALVKRIARGRRINRRRRYQTGLKVEDVFPTRKGQCACGCGKALTGKQRRWASTDCSVAAVAFFRVVKGDTRQIKAELATRGVRACGCGTEEDLDLHHRTPVSEGGAACGLDGYEIVCADCHAAHHPGNEGFVRRGRKGN